MISKEAQRHDEGSECTAEKFKDFSNVFETSQNQNIGKN